MQYGSCYPEYRVTFNKTELVGSSPQATGIHSIVECSNQRFLGLSRLLRPAGSCGKPLGISHFLPGQTLDATKKCDQVHDRSSSWLSTPGKTADITWLLNKSTQKIILRLFGPRQDHDMPSLLALDKCLRHTTNLQRALPADLAVEIDPRMHSRKSSPIAHSPRHT